MSASLSMPEGGYSKENERILETLTHELGELGITVRIGMVDPFESFEKLVESAIEKLHDLKHLAIHGTCSKFTELRAD